MKGASIMPESIRSTVRPTAMTSGFHREHCKSDGRFQGTGGNLEIHDLHVFLHAQRLLTSPSGSVIFWSYQKANSGVMWIVL